MSNDIHFISELWSQYSYPDYLLTNDNSDIFSDEELQELILRQLLITFHKGQTF